jgi:hypothetical protein
LEGGGAGWLAGLAGSYGLGLTMTMPSSRLVTARYSPLLSSASSARSPCASSTGVAAAAAAAAAAWRRQRQASLSADAGGPPWAMLGVGAGGALWVWKPVMVLGLPACPTVSTAIPTRTERGTGYVQGEEERHPTAQRSRQRCCHTAWSDGCHAWLDDRPRDGDHTPVQVRWWCRQLLPACLRPLSPACAGTSSTPGSTAASATFLRSRTAARRPVVQPRSGSQAARGPRRAHGALERLAQLTHLRRGP